MDWDNSEKNGLIIGGLNNENSDRDNKGVDFLSLKMDWK